MDPKCGRVIEHENENIDLAATMRFKADEGNVGQKSAPPCQLAMFGLYSTGKSFMHNIYNWEKKFNCATFMQDWPLNTGCDLIFADVNLQHVTWSGKQMKPQYGEDRRLAEEFNELTRRMELFTKPGCPTFMRSSKQDSSPRTLDNSWGGSVMKSRYVKQSWRVVEECPHFRSDHHVTEIGLIAGIESTAMYRYQVPKDRKQKKHFLTCLGDILKHRCRID